MPKAEYTDSMKGIRAKSLFELKKAINELGQEKTPASLQYSKRLMAVLDLYLGTLPKSYRSENVE